MSNVPPPGPKLQSTDLPAVSKPPGSASAPQKPATPAKLQPATKNMGTSLPPAKPEDVARAKLRRSIYWLLIALSAGAMIGRVLAVNSVDLIRVEARLKSEAVDQEKQKLQGSNQLAGMNQRDLEDLTHADWQKQRPFLGGNDRSRWLTIRALVEHGTYAIDRYVTDPKTYPNWDTIDMVMHPDSTGTPHLYSSKPPLLATLDAAPYWAIYKVSAAVRGTPITLGTHPYEIDRAMLLLVNVLPLVVYFWVLAKMAERYGRTDWGRIFVIAAAVFGTFLTTFAVVLNNHLPAAVATAIALYAGLRIWYDGERRVRYFLLAGFFAAFAASCELPALSFFALLSVALVWKVPRQTLMAYVPAALVVLIAFFLTNWIAHRSFIPAYAHREHGHLAANTRPAGEPSAASSAAASQSATAVAPANPNYEGTLKTDAGQTVTLRGNTNNWYDYEFTRSDGKLVQSYWRNPQGIDAGEASIGKYALNVLVGHHGIFSLTPIWLLAIPGLILLAAGRNYRMPAAAAAVALISIVCILFYIFRPLDERNYGGMTSGFRWLFWLAPLWLLALLPTADKLASALAGRLLACLLLALSVLSATYPVWNPWVHPWLMNLWTYLG